MENQVGDEVPSEAEADKLVKEVEALGKKLSKYGGSLSPEDRRYAAKPPDGSEATTQLIARLITKHGVKLPGVSAEDMLADLTLVQRLTPVLAAISTLERAVQDIVLQANSERWSATTAGYTALVRAMGADASLENEMKPALDAFGVGRKRSPRAPKPG